MSYLRERLSFYPWLLIPTFIYYLGSAQADSFDWTIFVFVYCFVIFMRAMDDFACFDFDRKQGKKHAYLQRGKSELALSMAGTGALLFMFLSFALPRMQLVQSFVFIGSHIPVYLWLRNHAAILAVSLAKYPFLFYVVAFQTEQEAWWWPVLGALYFIVREVLEEFAHLRNRVVEAVVAVGLIAAKYLSESL